MSIIGITNSKGGVGKSTLSVHLSVWLHQLGFRTVLVDCDAQQSSSQWMSKAEPNLDVIRLDQATNIIEELPLLRKEYDFVVADGPGSQSETNRAMLLRVDRAFVPCKASMLEVRALAEATRILKQAQDIRSGPPEATLILSMVDSRHRLTKDMREVANSLSIPLADHSLSLRQAYADASGQESVVWELGSSAKAAAIESRKLFSELFPHLNQTKSAIAKRRKK